VHRVVPDSRAQRIGLKEGDVIRTVNARTVADAGALRRAVSEAQGPLVIEVVRRARPETVREKAAP
jgi:S1-C subfamily serine protease